MNPQRPLPDPEHPLYAPFWAAAAEHRLALQRCTACGALRWPPAVGCPACLVPGGDWETVDGAGTVWSVAVYEHAFHPAFQEELPYVCALVELDAGPRLVSRLVGVDPDGRGIGLRVRPVFPEVAPGVMLVWFAPEPGAADA